MSTMRLHSAGWRWADQPEEALWWIIDGTQSDLNHERLLRRFNRLPVKPRVAYMANQMDDVPTLEWTYFKVPLESALVFRWIAAGAETIAEQDGRPRGASQTVTRQDSADRGRAQQEAAKGGDEPVWRQRPFQLSAWPNMARYGGALELTLACSRLLTAPASFDDVTRWGVAPDLLNQFLADAHRAGLLRLVEAAPGEPAAAPVVRAPEPVAAGRPGLLERLMKRLGF